MSANKSRRTQAERTAESARRLMDAAIELIGDWRERLERTYAATHRRGVDALQAIG